VLYRRTTVIVRSYSAWVSQNIIVWSYVDQVNIAALADDGTFNDVREAADA